MVGAALALAGCADDAGAVRQLDQICGRELSADAPGAPPLQPCVVEGDGVQTTGVTSDSIGFRLGPRYGMLRIRLRAIDEATGAYGALRGQTWSLDALVAASRAEGTVLLRSVLWGTCSGCPDDPADLTANLPEDYDWVPMVESLPALPWTAYSGAIPADAWLIFSGADVEIADVRLPGVDPLAYGP